VCCPLRRLYCDNATAKESTRKKDRQPLLKMPFLSKSLSRPRDKRSFTSPKKLFVSQRRIFLGLLSYGADAGLRFVIDLVTPTSDVCSVYMADYTCSSASKERRWRLERISQIFIERLYQLGLAKRAAPLSPTDVYVYSNGEMGIDSKRRERKKVSCFNISPDGATILIFICTPMSQKEPPAHSPLWPFFVTFFFGFLLYITFQSR
jgi:hypothetical protein